MQTELSKTAGTKKKQPATVRIATWSAHHRWLVFGLWLVLTVGVFFVSIAIGGTRSESANNPGISTKSESAQAKNAYNAGVTQEATQSFYLVVTNPTIKTSDPAYKATVAK